VARVARVAAGSAGGIGAGAAGRLRRTVRLRAVAGSRCSLALKTAAHLPQRTIPSRAASCAAVTLNVV
jgi:hypothetical protein